MQRVAFTFLLVLFAFFSLLIFARQSGEGQLANILGKPPLKEGSPLITFEKKKVKEIQITKGQEEARIFRKGSIWVTKGGKRVDHRKIEKLLFLLDTAKVIKQLPHSKKTKQGLKEESTEIKIRTHAKKGQLLYLNQQLPLFTGLEAEFPTFTASLKNGTTYACSSELNEQFLSGFSPATLRDKHPFFFHPKLLKEVIYDNKGKTLTLSKKAPESPWRITSPLSLATDTEQINLFIAKLYKLEANTVLDNIPSAESVEANYPASLEIKSFHQHFPDQTFGVNQEALYTHKGLSYQFNPEALQNILPSINALRSKTITSLDLKEIDRIILQSNTQPYPVTLAIQTNTANQKPRWKYEVNGTWENADERAVADLITALTQDKVKGFSLKTLPPNQESKKAITVIFKDSTEIHLDLFRSDSESLLQKKGNRESTILTTTQASKIKTRPSDWKEKKLWDFSPINLKGFQRKIAGNPVENYSYNFNLEQWKGQIGDQKIDLEIDYVSANGYLDFLESLTALNWMSPHSTSVKNNTEKSVLHLITLQQSYNNEGDSLGMSHTSLELFPIPNNNNLFLTKIVASRGEPEYCILDKVTAEALTKPIVYKN